MAKGLYGTIPDEEWERHKGEIVSLYRTTTLPRVMQQMSQRHGFHASKNQYTRMFKTWNIHKNGNIEDYKRIYKCTRKRQSEGKPTDYFLYGKKISQHDLEAKFDKYISFTERLFVAKDDETLIPDGFTILTPPAETTVFPPLNRVIKIDNLPWILFNQESESQLMLRKTLSDPATFMSIENSNISASQIYYQWPEYIQAFHVQQGLAPSSIYPSSSGFESMFFDNEGIFDALPGFGSSWVNISSNPHILDYEIPASLTVLLQKSTTQYLKTSLESIYKTYIVEDTQLVSNVTQNMNIDSNPTAYRLFSLFIYMTTNSLLPTHSVQEIYDWAYSNSCTWIFTEILKMKSTTIDVFATNLLPAAVLSGDGEMVRNLVSRNVDIDAPIGNPWLRKHPQTALSLAVRQRNIEMVKLLCDLGATPKIMEFDSIASYGKRDASLWSHKSIQLLRLLLKYGADPECFISDCQRGFPLVQAASEGSLEAVSLLIAAKAKVNLSISVQFGTALQAAAAGGHVQVVRALLEAEADANMICIASQDYDYAFSPMKYDGLQTPIQLAARASNSEIVILLLQNKALVNFCPILTTTSLEWIEARFASSEESRRTTDEVLPFAFAIQYAAQNANIPLVYHLLDAGAMVDSRIGLDYDSTPLQLAARSGNVELVSLLLAHNADVNAPPGRYNGRTAIQAAAESGNIKVMNMLLDARANVNALPGWKGGRTALQAALEKGHINAARRLLLVGACINANPGFSEGVTALQASVSFGDIEIVKEILSYRADVNAAAGPEGGLTALQVAVKHKNIDLLELLLQAGADVDALPSKIRNKTALQCAVYESWKQGVQLLLKYHPDVRMLPLYANEDWDESWGLSALGWAIYKQDHDIIVLLLDHGAGPNDPVKNSQDATPTAFIFALTFLDSYETIELFLERGADIFQCWDSETTLDIAIGTAYENFKVVRMIIDLIQQTTTGDHFDSSFRNSLTCIAGDDGFPAAQIELVQLLLNAGADINAKSVHDKVTILQKSASNGSPEVAEFLLQHGAEVSVPATRKIGTPLQEAIKWEQIEISNLLLEHGADVNALPAEEAGVTALQAAAIRGYVPLAVKLLERGADVTAARAPIDGRTAIDGAAEHGRLEMLQLLLNAYGDRGGLATVCDQAAGFAEREGHAAIAKWLRSYRAS